MSDEFWKEQVSSVIEQLEKRYNRVARIDWNGAFGTVKVTMDGKFVCSVPNDPRVVNYALNAILGTLEIERIHKLDEINRQLSRLFD